MFMSSRRKGHLLTSGFSDENELCRRCAFADFDAASLPGRDVEDNIDGTTVTEDRRSTSPRRGDPVMSRGFPLVR